MNGADELGMIGLLIDWYGAMGADEAIGEEPQNRQRRAEIAAPRDAVRAAAPREAPAIRAETGRNPAAAALGDRLAQARQLAAAAETVDALREAVNRFDGCSLKATATNTVFADGNPEAPLMLIGEAPGADEDRIGRPFVGASGQLLDRMLATIGIDRSSAYISNVLFWRPPGNRKPTDTEVALCRPFVERHIALVRPRFLILVGATANTALVGGSEGITRLRGRWFALTLDGIDQPIQAMAMYHPSYLLRSPLAKREAWLDLLSIKSKLEVNKK